WRHLVQAQRRVAHQGNVNAAQEVIDLVLIQAVIVLAHARAIADWLTQSHVMIIPVWTPRPGAGQPHGGRGENGAHQIVCAVPFTKPTAEHHEEYCLRILPNNVCAPNIRICAVRSHAAHADVAATTAAVAPEVSAGS